MRQRLLAEDPFGFRAVSPPARPAVPAQRLPRTVSRTGTRTRATVTTFGLWVKIPLTFLLIINPLVITVRDVYFGYYEVTPNTAADFFFNGVAWMVCIWITTKL